MCGVAGFWDTRAATTSERLNSVVATMSRTLVHRGPDDEGHWVDASAGIALGFRRLSIIDVSPTGHQPMFSESGRYVAIFNGEIYNYPELCAELLQSFSITMRGSSDTEVMLHGFDCWGLQATIRRLNGMFAMAVWDRTERALYLCRDRLGEKPLYYGWLDKTFVFGSELKSMTAHPEFRAGIDLDALAGYLQFGYVPTPRSIYQGVAKLPPATILKIKAGHSDPVPQAYWSMKEVVRSAGEKQFSGSVQEAAELLTQRLQRTVKSRMQSDVPLGAFLSGGIDSSTVVALMQSVSPRPVHTFSIGFKEESHNEAADAARVAKHLGTKHREFIVSWAEAREVLPRLPELFDEPFSDSSQIPTYLISRLAKQHVTVALTGDGGDEVFGGYNRYRWNKKLWGLISHTPRFFSSGLGKAITLLSPGAWEAVLGGRQPQGGQKMYKLAKSLQARSQWELYEQVSSVSPVPSELLAAEHKVHAPSDRTNAPATASRFVEGMMYEDTVTYLPDDILVKVDRASMGASLETRAPFLDHEIVEFAWSLPLAMKLHGGTGKYVLRKVLEKFVPRQLTDRPKAGFAIPIGAWLRKDLRDWAESALDSAKIRGQGYLDVDAVQKKWQEHLSGKRDWESQIWNILVLQWWLEARSNKEPVCASEARGF